MSVFHFRLASLLRIREGLAHREELRLSQMHGERMAQQMALDGMQRKIVECLEAREREAAEVGMDGVDLHLSECWRLSMKKAVAEIELKVAELAHAIAEQSERYTKAQRDVEGLQHLRASLREEWSGAQNRQQQKFNDELFLAKKRGSKASNFS